VILKMEEDMCSPIIIGRPFLATAGCHIDVKNGKFSFDVGMIMWSLTCLKLLKSLPFLMSVI